MVKKTTARKSTRAKTAKKTTAKRGLRSRKSSRLGF